MVREYIYPWEPNPLFSYPAEPVIKKMGYAKYRRTNRRFKMGRKVNYRSSRHRYSGKRVGGFKTLKHSAQYFLKKGHK